MNSRGVVGVLFFAGVVFAQPMAAPDWAETDGGFRLLLWPDTWLREPHAFVPNGANDEVVLRDSDDPKSEIRVQFTTPDPTPVMRVDAGFLREQLRWGSRSIESVGNGLRFQGGPNQPLRVTWGAPLRAVQNDNGTVDLWSDRAVWRFSQRCGIEPTFNIGEASLQSSCDPSDGLDVSVTVATIAVSHHGPLLLEDDTVAAATDTQVLFVGPGRKTWRWDPWRGGMGVIENDAEVPRRRRGGLAWDSARKRMVVFGGGRGDALLDDTWEWDERNWVRRQPMLTPPARIAHQLAFDPVRNRVVLFGGIGASGELGDTWEWDGQQWQQLAPTTAPTPRDAFGLAWDGNLQEVLLFGGWDGVGPLNDTWSWNGARWLQHTPTTVPEARSSLAMTWDPVERRVVMAGSLDATVSSAAWDGTNWTALGDLSMRRGSLVSLGDAGTYAMQRTLGTARLTGTMWNPVTISNPVASGSSEDGGSVGFSAAGERFEWSDDRWRIEGSAPFTNPISVARSGQGELVVLTTSSADTHTWVDGAGGWQRKADAPRGRLVTANDGAIWLFSGSSASTLTSGGWAPAPWPTLAVNDAHPRQEGGFWVVTPTGYGFVVDETWQRLGMTGGGLLVPRPRAPPLAINGNRLLGTFARADGGTQLLETGFRMGSDGVPSTWPVRYAGKDSSGAHLYQAAPPTMYRVAFERSVGSRCEFAEACLSGVCVDGRCCDRACGTSSCEVCSVARGASEEGVCTAAPASVCEARVDAGHVDGEVDGGVLEPMQPVGCGCSAESTSLPWLVLLGLALRRLTSRR